MKKIFFPFKLIYRIIDRLIIAPLTKLVFLIIKKLRVSPSFLEKYLNKPNILIYVSLILAVMMFIFVDNKATKLIENEAEILERQPITLIYNEEAFVVEGLPKTVDITLIGRRSDLYLAKQLGNHKVTLDLHGYTIGDHKVKLVYNNSVETVKYKLDPSTVQIKISDKISDSKVLAYDLFNQDKLDPKLSIATVTLSNSDVIVKSSQTTIDKIASVKALVDVSSDKLTSAGTFKLENIPLVAYDEGGKIINNVEMVPARVSADVIVSSNSVEVPVKVVTTGEATVGFAISEINASVSKVTLYGDQSILEDIKFVEATIDIKDLNANKTYNVTLTKPKGIRFMSASTTTIDVSVQKETSIETEISPIIFRNLDEKYAATASSIQDTSVTVIVKGVKSVLNSLDPASITAYIDLTGYGLGTHNVPINIEGRDVRLSFTPKVKTISVKIENKR